MSYRRLTARLIAAWHNMMNRGDSPCVQRSGRRRVGAAAMITLAVLAPLVVPVGPTADAQSLSFEPNGDHSIDINASNDRVIIAHRNDGTVGIRHDLSGSWSPFHQLGSGTWETANAAIMDNGNIHVIAVNSSNELYTATWPAGGDLGSPTLLASGIDNSTKPAIAANANEVALATVKTNSRLETRRFNLSLNAWGVSKDHWGNWVHVDLDLADDGDLWFAGVKNDGTLRVRKQLNGTWSGIKVMDRDLGPWSLHTAPSISANSSDIILAAVTEADDLYTIRQTNGTWQNDFLAHGQPNWFSADVALAPDGGASLIGVKNDGRLFTRASTTADTWAAFKGHGQPTWSTGTSPSIELRNNGRPTFVAAKSNGRVFARSEYANYWSGWLNMKNAAWETPEPAQQRPAWISGAQMALEGVDLTSFTVSWGDFAGGAFRPDRLELTVSNESYGPDQATNIYPSDGTVEFPVELYYNEPLVPGQVYHLSLVAVNGKGASAPLLMSFQLPTVIIFDVEETATDGTKNVSPLLSATASIDPTEPTTDVTSTFKGECGTLTTTHHFGYESIGVELTDVDGNTTHHEFPIYVGEHVAATFACHDGTNIVTNDLLPIACDELGPRDIFLDSKTLDPIGGGEGGPAAANRYGCEITGALAPIKYFGILSADITSSIVHTVSIQNGALTIRRQTYNVV